MTDGQTYIRSEGANPARLATLAAVLKVEGHLIVVDLKLQNVVPRKLYHLRLQHNSRQTECVCEGG